LFYVDFSAHEIPTGYLCATGWQCSISSTSFLAGTIIQGLLVLNIESYNYQRWHGTLLVIAIAAFAIVFNTFLAKRLPLVEGFLLIIHIVGLFAIIIPLWVLAPRNSAKAVFTQFANTGGWSSTGVSVLVGMAQIASSMAGFDCAVHMCECCPWTYSRTTDTSRYSPLAEEIKDASVTLPRSILTGVAVNGISGFLMIVTLSFTLGDVNSILSTPTGYPFIQIIYNATQNFAGTDIMVSILVVTLTSSVISEVATSSRQLWSFARDGALPFSSTIAHVSLL
jgi:amino acid transporter